MRLTVLSFYLTLAVALAAVGGCGVKPGKLTPPPSAQKDTFPKVYPDPATDPKPESQPQP